MKKTALVLAGMILAQIPAFAHADDCRNSSTENCFFTAAAIITGPGNTLPMGELYFKTDDGYFPPDSKTLVIVSPKGQNSIYLYNRVTAQTSPEIAKITGPSDNSGEAYTMELSPNVLATYVGAHDVPYSYCHTGSFGPEITMSLKTVKEMNITRTDGSPVFGSMTSVMLTSESNFRELSSVSVAACPQ